MIGTGDGQQYETPFEHAEAVGGPPTHSPEWIGNQRYGNVFNWAEQYPEAQGGPLQINPLGATLEAPLTEGPGFRTGIDQHELDMEKFNVPKNLPPSNPALEIHPNRGGGWSRVADIDRSHEVPYISGADKDVNSNKVYIDKKVPVTATISGKTFDTSIPLSIHELTERHVMEQLKSRGMTNEKAYEIAHHEYAEPAEDNWYRSQGIDVKEANKFWSKIDQKTEQDKGDFPPNLYKAPYPHDKVEGLKHEPSGVSDEWAIGKKVAGDVVKFPITDEKRKENTDFGKKIEELDPNAPKAPVVPFRLAMDEHRKDYNPSDALDPMPGTAGMGMPKITNPRPSQAQPEAIHSAAIRTPEGKVYTGINHAEAYIKALESKGMSHNDTLYNEDQGFVTTKGRFVDRHEALDIAKAKSQMLNEEETLGQYLGFGLMSEDLK